MEINFIENLEFLYDFYDIIFGIELIVENEWFRVCRCFFVYVLLVFKSMLILEFKEK